MTLTLTNTMKSGTVPLRMIYRFIKKMSDAFGSFSNFSLRGKIFAVSAVVLLLAGGLALVRVYNNSQPVPASEQVLPTVSLLTISSLNDKGTGLTLTGTLRSKSEADLRSEVSGRITGVYAKVGKWVTSGTLIAEVENSAQKAQVTQALGALQAAKAQATSAEAQLSKMQGGTRSEQLRVLEAALTDAQSTHLTAEQGARNALLSAYATVNQSVIHSTDTLFKNASKYNPKVDFTVSDATLRNELSAERIDIRYILDRHEDATLTEPADISAEITTTIIDLQKIKRFYDKLLIAVDKAVIASEVSAGYSATVGPARASMLAQISALTAANDALVRSENAINISQANLDQGASGAQQEDLDSSAAQVSVANASVTSALGSYQAALAGLEKTRVRAPISGTLSSFSARRGDFVNTQALGRIVGTGGSEVIFNIPSSDRARITIGDDVLVSGTITGKVTSVSNSTDALSQQLEVRADLSTKSTAPNGSVVSIKLINKEAVSTDILNIEVLVPINAIKFSANETVMFTIDEADVEVAHLVALPIILGDVRGSMVFVSGVSNSTLVVTDARGLSAGQDVELSLPETILLEN